MSTNEITDSSDTDDSLEPFPTDGEEHDYEAAATEMGLSYPCTIKIDDDVFEYQGICGGEVMVVRILESSRRKRERFPVTELWDTYQRGNLKIGELQCEFVAKDESATDND